MSFAFVNRYKPLQFQKNKQAWDLKLKLRGQQKDVAGHQFDTCALQIKYYEYKFYQNWLMPWMQN